MSDTVASQVAGMISEERLWRLLMEVAQYGATENGGVNRQALSVDDVKAKKHLTGWAQQRGFGCCQDDVGNLFIRREGLDPTLDPVMTGSHLDSQPTGGRFDGAYGVIAGLEVLEVLEDSGLETLRPIEVVSWTNEEGSRFSPGAMGSSVFTGVRQLSDILNLTDRDGASFKEALSAALAAVPIARRSAGDTSVHSYVEAHIEQGPILEECGIEIGAVTGVQGIRRMEIEVIGEEAHAGTTPLRLRKDAFAASVSIASALERLATDASDTLRFTIGCCEVFPGSPNTVPGRVRFTIDLRHPENDVLLAVAERIKNVAGETCRNCSVNVHDISHVAPSMFDREIVTLIQTWSHELGYQCRMMSSGAGHDAMHLGKICPTAMIFVPCLRGVSHNEAESATPEQLANGARVLAATLVTLGAQ